MFVASVCTLFIRLLAAVEHRLPSGWLATQVNEAYTTTTAFYSS